MTSIANTFPIDLVVELFKSVALLTKNVSSETVILILLLTLTRDGILQRIYLQANTIFIQQLAVSLTITTVSSAVLFIIGHFIKPLLSFRS